MLSCHYSLPVSITFVYIKIFIYPLFLSTTGTAFLQRVDTGNRVGSVINKFKLWFNILPNFNIRSIFEYLFMYFLLH